ncbi:MAG TPA: 3-keto-5-aminohexanoate cleavage protein [Thermoleophilaceae bacterium]|nr:3-keto-5-aminohexanoate cleavage protein [Thermoleophilaceae bacterium]
MPSIGPRPSPLLAVALNGSRAHPRAPRTARELAEAARASVDAGARVVHLHPYDGQGRETLAAEPCAEALRAVRAAVPGVPVSLSTSAEIEPDPRRRLELVGGWTVLPELVTANQGEPGIAELCEHLIGRGVGIEAGLLSVAEAGDFERSHRNRSNGGATTMGAAGSLSAVYPGEVATRARAQRTRPLGRRGRPASRAGGAEFTVTG